MTLADAVDPRRDLLCRHGLPALLLDTVVFACDMLSVNDADPVPWTWPSELDNLRHYLAFLLVSRHGAFLAILATGTPEITLQVRLPQMHPIVIPGLKRLAAAPEGAAPIIDSMPRASFGIPANPEDDSATVRHRALLVKAHRDTLGKAAFVAWQRQI